jgi:hypothetical protein
MFFFYLIFHQQFARSLYLDRVTLDRLTLATDKFVVFVGMTVTWSSKPQQRSNHLQILAPSS